jgi:transposase
MMGSRDPRKQLWNYQVNLDKRVRSDHPPWRINEVLELDFVRAEVARFYGRKGNVSEDPVVIVKMMILLFLEDVRSERELMRIIPERLDYMWFLGYGLDDAIPNHSVLSKARRRWGQEVFDTLFYRLVPQCVEAGLVDGSKIHVDSSLIEADASTQQQLSHDDQRRDRKRFYRSSAIWTLQSISYTPFAILFALSRLTERRGLIRLAMQFSLNEKYAT